MLGRMLGHASSLSEKRFQREPFTKSIVSGHETWDVCDANQSATICMVDSLRENALRKEKIPAKAILFERAQWAATMFPMVKTQPQRK